MVCGLLRSFAFRYPVILMIGISIQACASETTAAPNILLIIADDLNTDIASYGHPQVETPNIDRLAASGVQFNRAYAQYPQCNQSRASILTGLYPDQTGVLSLHENFRDHLPDITTLPQHFKNNGYFTARVGKVFHQGVPNDIGSDGMDDPHSWDEVVNPRGIDRELHDQIISIVPQERDQRKFGGTLSWFATESTAPHTDQLGAAAAINLMARHHPDKTGKPFFLALGFYRPHTPYVAPREYFDRYPLGSIELNKNPPDERTNKPVAALADRPYQADMTNLQMQQAIQAYYASISFIDAQLGRVMDALGNLKLVDNTIVVFVSDHGYQLGRHGLWQKADLFEHSARVPLVIATPNQIQPGQQTNILVELVDVYPTLVALSNIARPEHALSGKDIHRSLEATTQGNNVAFTQAWSVAHRTRPERNKMKVMGYSIRTEQYRYTEWSEGREGAELYDYQSDPNENQNLAMLEAYQPLVNKMKTLLVEKKLLAR